MAHKKEIEEMEVGSALRPRARKRVVRHASVVLVRTHAAEWQRDDGHAWGILAERRSEDGREIDCVCPHAVEPCIAPPGTVALLKAFHLVVARADRKPLHEYT